MMKLILLTVFNDAKTEIEEFEDYTALFTMMVTEMPEFFSDLTITVRPKGKEGEEVKRV